METRILVVDDDPELRENIVEVLDVAGFDTAVAETGEDALRKTEETCFDLIILDLMMPRLGGMEALPLLRKKCPRAKIIVITAFSTVEVAVEAMRKGADDYISKPFKVNDLLMTIRRNIEEARFQACRMALDMDGTFNCLSNSIRRRILLIGAQEEPLRFMDIVRHLGIEDHTKVNFHLRILKEANLIAQEERKLYVLTDEGKRLVECIRILAENLSG
jgi:DNA-binding response OmpR family regulator